VQVDARHDAHVDGREVNHMVQRQGIVFSVLALVASLAALFVPRMTAPNELLVIGALIVLMGVPHGALDTVFARTRYSLASWQRWLVFTLAYCGVMASVAVVWYYSPSLFLIGFLVLSAAHFSGDPTAGTALLSRLAYGGAVVILPVLRFGPSSSTCSAYWWVLMLQAGLSPGSTRRLRRGCAFSQSQRSVSSDAPGKQHSS